MPAEVLLFVANFKRLETVKYNLRAELKQSTQHFARNAGGNNLRKNYCCVRHDA
ncbi:hypothetical protein GLAREA_08170 [Glarea lozoyensis ATCC 20868]|uniref:Uncharacterized protein n=1 Tax=Glarea lozoyensis (strain ATCC 20868 / MF5171) TaxID=1116229 RepID=S3DCD7_GLAL2|nr:uncharacterized protein GLAREA_08170 [Glarea lozoyensis ATCC 20868]EPE24318.1 hypothetical protein GLAREA_08170 [Glarea lozoyensis ATCC 20868]